MAQRIRDQGEIRYPNTLEAIGFDVFDERPSVEALVSFESATVTLTREDGTTIGPLACTNVPGTNPQWAFAWGGANIPIPTRRTRYLGKFSATDADGKVWVNAAPFSFVALPENPWDDG